MPRFMNPVGRVFAFEEKAAGYIKARAPPSHAGPTAEVPRREEIPDAPPVS